MSRYVSAYSTLRQSTFMLRIARLHVTHGVTRHRSCNAGPPHRLINGSLTCPHP